MKSSTIMKTYTTLGKEKGGLERDIKKLKISNELDNILAKVWEMCPMWLKVCFQVSGGKTAESRGWQQVGKLALWSGCNSRPQRTVQAHSLPSRPAPGQASAAPAGATTPQPPVLPPGICQASSLCQAPLSGPSPPSSPSHSHQRGQMEQ